MLKNKNNFESIHFFFIVRPRTFQTTIADKIKEDQLSGPYISRDRGKKCTKIDLETSK